MDQQQLITSFIDELNSFLQQQPEAHNALIQLVLPYIRQNNTIAKMQADYEAKLQEVNQLQQTTSDELVIATQYATSLERKLADYQDKLHHTIQRIKEYERMHAILFIKIDELKREHFKEPVRRTINFSEPELFKEQTIL